MTPYRADLLVEQNAQAAFSLANYGYVLEVGSGAILFVRRLLSN